MEMPSDLSTQQVQCRLISQVVGRSLEVRRTVGSTNDVLLAAAGAGAPEGLAVLADRQTAGRGRRGRAWASPPDVGLYTSILLRPKLPCPPATLLTLVAGLATSAAIQEVARVGSRLSLKWPNDVLIDGRKAAGVLVEMASLEDRVTHAVIGIGINVNHGLRDFPEELRTVATSLRLATGRAIRRAELAAAVYNHLDCWYRAFGEADAETIVGRAREQSATLGRPVEVLGEREQWRGLAVDLDLDGALLVRDQNGRLQRVLAGDVTIRTVARDAI